MSFEAAGVNLERNMRFTTTRDLIQHAIGNVLSTLDLADW